MKTLIHFTLLFTLCTNYFLSAVSEASNASVVLDGNGDAVEVGSTYYIRPAKSGDGVGGGVTVAATGAQRCPLTVVQEIVDVQNGLQVSFHPSDPEARMVSLSSNINIKFDRHVPCANSTVWRLGKQYIEIDGKLGDAGCATAENWFKIETDSKVIPNSYKIVFNGHGVCPTAMDRDLNIAVSFYSGLRPLIVSSADMFEVKFWKHEDPVVAVS